MTISDTPTTYRYEGNGVTDTFAYNARVFNAGDLVIEIITRATDALDDTLTLTTDYSVTIADNGTASIIVTAPNIPSTLQDIQIRRALDKTQSVSLPTGTVFPAKDVESAIDRAVAISQDIAADLERTAKVPVGFSGTDVVLPLPSDGKALIWSGTDGLMINGPTAADISNAQSYAEDAETAKDAAEAAQAATELAAANLPLNNEMGSGAPTVNDDSGDGYSVGSKWYDLSASPPEAYLCLGSTVGAAIWVQTTVDSEDLGTAAFVDVIDEDDMATDSETRPPSQQSVKAYVDASGRGFKNLIINGDFRINQRSYVSAAALSAGIYGHDRWKAGASGGAYSFVQAGIDTVITIASGKSLIQVLEAANIEGGSYILSWAGTAQARYAVNSATPSGSYASSPITITGQTADTVMSIEFGPGTVSKVQFELGSAATPFERRPNTTELLLCRRYYQKPDGYCGSVYSASDITISGPITPEMRTTPTFAVLNASAQIVAGSATPTGSSVSIVTSAPSTAKRMRLRLSGWSGLTAGQGCYIYTDGSISADAEL